MSTLLIQMEDMHERIKKLEGSTENRARVAGNEEIENEDEFDRVPLIETANDLTIFERKLKNSSFLKKSVISLMNFHYKILIYNIGHFL